MVHNHLKGKVFFFVDNLMKKGIIFEEEMNKGLMKVRKYFDWKVI